MIGQSSDVAEASSALNEVPALLRLDLDLLRKLEEPLVLDAELAEASLTPAPDVAFPRNGKTEEGAAGYVAHRSAVEGAHVVRSGSDLHALADAELALEAPAPGVDVGFVSEHEGVVLTAGDLDDALVPERLQYGGREGALGSAVANSALDTGAIGEDVAVAGEVEGVVAAALHEHQVAHVLLLLGPRGAHRLLLA